MVKIKNKIFQIFLEVNRKFEEYPMYGTNKILWKNYAERNGFQYIFIDYNNIEKYLGKYKQFYDELKYVWNQIDFLKYIVINQHSGIYIDLDIAPKDNNDLFKLLERDHIVGIWKDPKTNKYEVSNSIIGFPAGALDELVNYSIAEYVHKLNMEIYKIRKIRFMKHTTGVCMFKRYCKSKKIEPDIVINDYIIDYESKAWLSNFN